MSNTNAIKPTVNIPTQFTIHTDATYDQLGGVISKNGKPVAFFNRKFDKEPIKRTSTEKEILSLTEAMKEYGTLVNGHALDIHTDNKSLVHKRE